MGTHGLVGTEMGSSKAIYYNDEKTKRLFNAEGEKRPISFQIFGSDEETIAHAAKYVSGFADILDLNMGCPAPKVVKNGDGSKLLQDLVQAEKVIKAAVENSTVPVTLKFRIGWDKENIVAVELAKIAEKNGITAITVHGRTRSQFYTETADLNVIKKVKESVSIPVIGNGDVVDIESARVMFEKTGVDGIMIGRGSFGNPWIFEEIINGLTTGVVQKPTINERKRVVLEHLDLAVEEKGEIAIKEFRKNLAWYTKNLKNSSEFRNDINKVEEIDCLKEAINEYFDEIEVSFN